MAVSRWRDLCILFLTLKPLDKVNCAAMHFAPDDVLREPKILFTSSLCHQSRAKQVWEWVKFQSTNPFVVPEVNSLAAESNTTKVNWDHLFKDKDLTLNGTICGMFLVTIASDAVGHSVQSHAYSCSVV